MSREVSMPVTGQPIVLPVSSRRGSVDSSTMLETKHQGPQCTACGSPMRLTAIEPNHTGQDLRTFTCPCCRSVQQYLIESAVTDAWPELHAPSKSVAETRSLTKFATGG
jgi:hypothetical protein